MSEIYRRYNPNQPQAASSPKGLLSNPPRPHSQSSATKPNASGSTAAQSQASPTSSAHHTPPTKPSVPTQNAVTNRQSPGSARTHNNPAPNPQSHAPHPPTNRTPAIPTHTPDTESARTHAPSHKADRTSASTAQKSQTSDFAIKSEETTATPQKQSFSTQFLHNLIPRSLYNPETKKILGLLDPEDLLIIALIFLFMEDTEEDNPLMILALFYILFSDSLDLGDFLF